jgi:hypothetical protein
MPAKAPVILAWLYSGNITGKLEEILDRRTPNTGLWFLKEFQQWLGGSSKLMLCPGIRTLSFSEISDESSGCWEVIPHVRSSVTFSLIS